MQNPNPADVRKIRPFALTTAPFIALFAYELSTLLSHRPSVPDLIHGYTIALGSEGSARHVYVSPADLTLLLAPFLCGFVVMTIGVWRAGLFRQFLRR